jgi:uncharacterized protein YcsI (UPF0317 family)
MLDHLKLLQAAGETTRLKKYQKSLVSMDFLCFYTKYNWLIKNGVAIRMLTEAKICSMFLSFTIHTVKGPDSVAFLE